MIDKVKSTLLVIAVIGLALAAAYTMIVFHPESLPIQK